MSLISMSICAHELVHRRCPRRGTSCRGSGSTSLAPRIVGAALRLPRALVRSASAATPPPRSPARPASPAATSRPPAPTSRSSGCAPNANTRVASVACARHVTFSPHAACTTRGAGCIAARKMRAASGPQLKSRSSEAEVRLEPAARIALRVDRVREALPHPRARRRAASCVDVEVAARAAAAREIDVAHRRRGTSIQPIGLLSGQPQRRGAQDRRVDLEPAQVQPQHVQLELEQARSHGRV